MSKIKLILYLFNSDKQTILHFVVDARNRIGIKVVKVLIAAGADVNAQTM